MFHSYAIVLVVSPRFDCHCRMYIVYSIHRKGRSVVKRRESFQQILIAGRAYRVTSLVWWTVTFIVYIMGFSTITWVFTTVLSGQSRLMTEKKVDNLYTACCGYLLPMKLAHFNKDVDNLFFMLLHNCKAPTWMWFVSPCVVFSCVPSIKHETGLAVEMFGCLVWTVCCYWKSIFFLVTVCSSHFVSGRPGSK